MGIRGTAEPFGINWFPEPNLHRVAPETPASRPHFVGAFQPDGNYGNPQLDREYGRTLFEISKLAVDGSRTLRKNEQDLTLLQARCADLQGLDKIRVGIHGDDARHLCSEAHDPSLEVIRVAEDEDFVDHAFGQYGYQK